MKDVYRQLQQRLDQFGTGYPATENGVELKILQRMFTEEEAGLFLQVGPMLEAPEAVAERSGREVADVTAALDVMAKKGLLFRKRKGDDVRYAAVPYVVGIFEYQLGSLDAGFVRENEEYFEKALGPTFQSFQTPVLRTVPIKKELVAEWPVAPFEDVMEIIDSQKKIAVAPCICRSSTRLIDQACGKPVENCFVFGSHGEYYVENGMGKWITKEEAKEIVRKNEAAGLVMQPFNAQNVGGMCSCCGCCCGMLRSLKQQPSPARAVKSNYYAAVAAADCTGCETCAERCQMDAVSFADSVAVVDLERCIGCGLCVTTCPTEAVTLVKKSAQEQYVPPLTGAETYIRIAKERGMM